jgi:hypothetical protein
MHIKTFVREKRGKVIGFRLIQRTAFGVFVRCPLVDILV